MWNERLYELWNRIKREKERNKKKTKNDETFNLIFPYKIERKNVSNKNHFIIFRLLN